MMRKSAILLVASFVAVLIAPPSFGASLRMYGEGPAIEGCTKPSAVDFAGYTTECHEAPENPSYINPNWFDDVRQSGQSPYYWNASTIPHDVTGVHVGAGCDLTRCFNKSPTEVSFSASTGSITGGVLTVNPLHLDATYGIVAIDQYVTCTGCPTSPRAKITEQLGPTTWQLDQPSLTVSGTPAISGSRYPQISCNYRTALSGISSTPIVACFTNGDNTTPTLFTGYDMDGVSFRLVAGGGAGANGEFGDLTIEHNRWKCNPANQQTSIITGINTHGNFYVKYNDHDGMYPTCTGQAFLSNLVVGTPSQSRDARVAFNVLRNEGVLPMSGSGASGAGGGYYTTLSVDNNVVLGTNLSGAFHGAVYALNLGGDKMISYTYRHNLLHAYPAEGPAGLGTTVMSILATAATDQDTRIDDMAFIGNISVTNIPSVSQPLTPCTGGSAVTATQTALWQNVGINSFGTLLSRGNLVDPTGATGCAIYFGGSGVLGTASMDDGTPGDGLTTMTMTVNSGNLLQNAVIHVNNTPYEWCATITYNGDGASGSMVLDTVTSGCPSSPPPLAAGMGVAGIMVTPGTYISAKADNTHFTVKNPYCSGTASCTADHFTLSRIRVVSACYMMPIGTVDPITGLPSTGTGKNTGTYILACDQTDISRNTYRQYGPTLGSMPDVNDGTDMLLSTGAATYLGGKNWDSGIAP